MGSWASCLLVGACLGRTFIGSALAAVHFAQERDGRIHVISHGWSLSPTAPLGQSWLEVSSPGPAGRILLRPCSGTCCRKQTLKDIFYKAMRWHPPHTAAVRRQVPGGIRPWASPAFSQLSQRCLSPPMTSAATSLVSHPCSAPQQPGPMGC